MRTLLALLFASGCGSGDSPAAPDTGSHSPVDESESCLWLPCITDRTDAVVTGEVLAGRFGQGIAVLNGVNAVAVAGGPASPNGNYDSLAEAVELTLPELARGATWPTDTAWDYSTSKMAIREDPAGGYVLALGAILAHGPIGRPGAVYLLHSSAPSGDSIQAAAYATISGDGAGFANGGQIGLGVAVQWLDLTGTGVAELVVSASGTPPFPGDTVPDGSAIYVFSQDVTGSLDVFDADRKITAPASGLGSLIAGWDGDSDGITDLVASQWFMDASSDRVSVFSSPWTNDLTADDATAAWTLETSGSGSIDGLANLGDVTGDGAPDLFVGAASWSGDGFDLAGAAWVLPGGNLVGGNLLDAPIHFYGDEPGEGCGYDAASGDFDGDGDLDLAIGCYGRMSGALPGKIVIFRGPLPSGPLDESLADLVIHGEFARDEFGMNLESIDMGLGGRAKLLVGAPGATGVEPNAGRVYLLEGDGLFP